MVHVQPTLVSGIPTTVVEDPSVMLPEPDLIAVAVAIVPTAARMTAGRTASTEHPVTTTSTIPMT